MDFRFSNIYKKHLTIKHIDLYPIKRESGMNNTKLCNVQLYTTTFAATYFVTGIFNAFLSMNLIQSWHLFTQSLVIFYSALETNKITDSGAQRIHTLKCPFYDVNGVYCVNSDICFGMCFIGTLMYLCCNNFFCSIPFFFHSIVVLVGMHIAVLIYFVMSNPYLVHTVSEMCCFHGEGMFDV